MASINISLPDPMRDYVQERIERGQYANASDYFQDWISRDQDSTEDQKRLLRDLEMSVSDTLAEMKAGGGVELVTACNAAPTSFERSV